MNLLRLKHFFTQPIIWQTMVFTALLLLGGALFIYLRIQPTDRLLILHYTIPFGIDLLGPWHRLYEIPVAGGVIALINFTLAYIFYVRQRNIAIALSFVTLLLSLMLSTGLYLIISQNTR